MSQSSVCSLNALKSLLYDSAARVGISDIMVHTPADYSTFELPFTAGSAVEVFNEIFTNSLAAHESNNPAVYISIFMTDEDSWCIRFIDDSITLVDIQTLSPRKATVKDGRLIHDEHEFSQLNFTKTSEWLDCLGGQSEIIPRYYSPGIIFSLKFPGKLRKSA